VNNIVEMPIAKAINAGLRQALINDPKTLIFGEDVAELGGVFRVTEGLHKEFGQSRVFNSPIAESGIVGTAIGLAMRGYRPIVEIQFDGFIFPAFDQITTQLAKLQNRSEGFLTMPVVIRFTRGQPEQFKRRLLDDSAGNRVNRPRVVLRTKATLLAEGHGEPRRSTGSPARRTSFARGNSRDHRNLRTDGSCCTSSSRDCSGRRQLARSNRHSLDVAN
jgi:Transketolase, pyrimidine binding domain